jgi:hypothetical protein
VARERVTTLEAENVALRTTNDTLARSQLFAAHPTKWTPALREKYGAESVAFLTKMTEDLPAQTTAGEPAVPPGTSSAPASVLTTATLGAAGAPVTTQAGAPPPGRVLPLTEQQKKIAQQMGLSELAYAEQLAVQKKGSTSLQLR